jgi:hypothetical protein
MPVPVQSFLVSRTGTGLYVSSLISGTGLCQFRYGHSLGRILDGFADTDGFSLGLLDGFSDGLLDGIPDGLLDGFVDGISLGLLD